MVLDGCSVDVARSTFFEGKSTEKEKLNWGGSHARGLFEGFHLEAPAVTLVKHVPRGQPW